MKKTLLAAALLAGFAGAASAQSSVTLYGIVDIGLQYQSISLDNAPKSDGGLSSSRFGMTNGTQNGSRWGLRGTEDLGNGLRAVFVLESGFDSANGGSGQGGRLFGRQSTLGLASNAWGQVDLGRQTNMASKYFAPVDPFGAGFSQANIGMAFGSANTVRYSNMIMYQTPSISGFNAGIGYSFDTAAGGFYPQNPGTSRDETDYPSMNNMRALTLGLNYSNGPLYLAAAYDQAFGPNNLKGGAPEAKPKAWLLGGTYDFKVVKLALAYGQNRGGAYNPQSIFGTNQGYIDVAGVATDYSGSGNSPSAIIFDTNAGYNSYLIGLSAPIGGAHKVFGSWTMAQPSGSLRAEYNGKNQNTYSLGYTYDFSKRTNLYAYVSYQSNWAFVDSAKSTIVGTGLRHRF